MSDSPPDSSNPETRLATGIFPAPFLHLHWYDGELNEALRHETLNRTAQSGISVSNRGGWHSDRDIIDSASSAVRRLKPLIITGLNRYADTLEPPTQSLNPTQWEIEAWVNVNPAEAWNIAHTHTARNNAISGVYYVMIPAPLDSAKHEGAIVFEDHGGNPVPADHLNAKGTNHREFALYPAEGDMVIFPAWLHHRVEAHSSDQPRISVAFNARHPGVTVPRYPDMIEPNWRWRNFAGAMKAIRWLERKIGSRSHQ